MSIGVIEKMREPLGPLSPAKRLEDVADHPIA
jgi:hypothetical protein